jgi:hypothetical protein
LVAVDFASLWMFLVPEYFSNIFRLVDTTRQKTANFQNEVASSAAQLGAAWCILFGRFAVPLPDVSSRPLFLSLDMPGFAMSETSNLHNKLLRNNAILIGLLTGQQREEFLRITGELDAREECERLRTELADTMCDNKKLRCSLRMACTWLDENELVAVQTTVGAILDL